VAALPEKALTLLVADDEELVLRAICRMFEKRGHTVLQATSAAEALSILDGCQPHAVLVDQNMPGSGLTVLEHLMNGRSFPGLAVLMTGGHDEGETRGIPGEVLRLQKPFRMGDAIRLVEARCASV
jgi:CheY-like chemotaxis protein